MVAHADTDGGDLGHVDVGDHVGGAGAFLHFFHDGQGLLEILAGDGEGHVGMAVKAGVLDDHVHQHALFGKGAEDGGGHAGHVGKVVQGDVYKRQHRWCRRYRHQDWDV